MKKDLFLPRHSCQHGYVPFRGTLSAWRTFLRDHVQSPNLLSFDLEKAYDSINLSWLESKLVESGVPLSIAHNIMLAHRTPSINKDLVTVNVSALSSSQKAAYAKRYPSLN